MPAAAAVCQVRGGDEASDEWLVLVQPAAALAAVDAIDHRFAVARGLALGLYAVLAGGFWAWLGRSLRREVG